MRIINQRKQHWFILFLLAAFIALQSILFALIISYQYQRADSLRLSAMQHLATQRGTLEGLMNINLVSMRGLQAEFVLDPNLSEERFERIAAQLLDHSLHTRHIAAAPDLVITYIYPVIENYNAIGVDYRDLPAQLESVNQAIATEDISIQPPTNLVQGGRAMIARIPVRLENGELWGVISQVIDYQRLFTDAGIGSHANQPFTTALQVDGVHQFGDTNVWAQEPVLLDVSLGQMHWQLGAYPADGDWRWPLAHFYRGFIVGNVIILAILALLMLAFSSHRRLQATHDLIERQAQTDPLTGLISRSYIRQLIERYIHYCALNNEQFCVLFIDLDHFKQVNDSLGHDVGDALLVEVAQRLRMRLRERDLIARLGGDEFVVVLKQVGDLDTSLNLAHQIQQTLADSFEVDGHTLHMYSSIGIALYPSDGKDVSTLLKNADLAMYSAKSAGRNTSAFFDVSMQQEAQNHLSLSNALREGLKNGQFKVFYQPIVAKSGKVSHVEALVRWLHPTRGLIAPGAFIEVAEKSGAIHALGDFVLAQACQDLALLKQHWPHLKLAVNRSPLEFNDAANPARWLNIIQLAHVKPSDVIFEITESLLMPQQARQQTMIQHLQQQGIAFAIDDFGTGYSSVSYLRRFPAELIKLDKSFVDPLPHDADGLAMAAVLVQMAKALRIRTVAEGVETKAQAACLDTLGVDYQQGYYYAKPLALEKLMDWMRRFEQTDD